MKRLLISFAVFIAILAGVIYFSAGYLLGQITEKSISYLKQNAGKYGYQVYDLNAESVGLSSFNAVQWKDISIDLGLRLGDKNKKTYRATAEAENISMTVIDFQKKLIKLRMKHLKAFRVTDKRTSSIDKTVVKVSEFKTQFPIDFTNISTAKENVQTLIENLRRLIIHGRTTIPIEFSGNCLFGINQQPVTAGIMSERRGNEYVVVMKTDDLRKIAQMVGEEDVNEAEIKLLSENPIRAPKLLNIRNKARSRSKQVYTQNSSISEDAYRHVLWSYYLTKEYGERFAKEVTDAHEIGATDNTEADHKMDYNNNEIGRVYAKQNLSELQVIQRAASDPRIIGFVSQVR